jgi:formylglycine-generating enzyme
MNPTQRLLGTLLMIPVIAANINTQPNSVRAEAPAQLIGIADAKPESGPSVSFEGKFLVPYTEVIPGTDIEFEMIPIAGGKYMMGSPKDEEGRKDDEGPQIEVTVDPMWVAKTEVSWAQYKEYMRLYAIFKDFEAKGERTVTDENRVDAITAPTELYDPSFTFEYGEEPEQAAVSMTQYSAQQFTKWLSRITDRQYRLPTEAEWEYAARGNTKTAYSFGKDATEIDDYAWYYDNSDNGQSAIGLKKPNAFGLHDMHGNVAEWTVNQYTEDGYKEFVSTENKNATYLVKWPETEDNCVVRGGSWEGNPEDLRSAVRLPSNNEEWKQEDPNYPKSPWWFTSDPARGVGFRLFRSAKPLDKDYIAKFWEPGPEDLRDDIESRIDNGRGGWGKVDPDLPKAVQEYN